VHPLEQRDFFLDLHSAFLWPTADCVYSCSISLSSCFSRISLAGSRRQLSIRKNERKGELAMGEVDVDIGGEERNQANNSANGRLPARLCRRTPATIRAAEHPDPKIFIHLKQPEPIP
jgi:hypothetical protein